MADLIDRDTALRELRKTRLNEERLEFENRNLRELVRSLYRRHFRNRTQIDEHLVHFEAERLEALEWIEKPEKLIWHTPQGEREEWFTGLKQAIWNLVGSVDLTKAEVEQLTAKISTRARKRDG